jgi:hypothetical protein
MPKLLVHVLLLLYVLLLLLRLQPSWMYRSNCMVCLQHVGKRLSMLLLLLVLLLLVVQQQQRGGATLGRQQQVRWLLALLLLLLEVHQHRECRQRHYRNAGSSSYWHPIPVSGLAANCRHCCGCFWRCCANPCHHMCIYCPCWGPLLLLLLLLHLLRRLLRLQAQDAGNAEATQRRQAESWHEVDAMMEGVC